MVHGWLRPTVSLEHNIRLTTRLRKWAHRQHIVRRGGESHNCSRYAEQPQRLSYATAATNHVRTRIGRRVRLRWILALLLILLIKMLLLRRPVIAQEREGEYQIYRLDLFFVFISTADRLVRLLRTVELEKTLRRTLFVNGRRCPLSCKRQAWS